jgi:hypothetical protein
MKVILNSALIFGVIFIYFASTGKAQFPPPVGRPGTTAIYKDSSAFIGWATGCTVHRGYIKISDTTLSFQGSNKASYGLDTNALGKADDSPVSLGDGGYAILTFDRPIVNGPGFDFAVFENGLDSSFLELAFVEVSSDGINYFRFPAISDTQDTLQIPTFGKVEARKINNLAGKYQAMFGTPFDLDTLKGNAGLDLDKIQYVKVMDVVGCIQTPYATYDSRGHKVNDPWPTPFNTGGFDLDAVGVIHMAGNASDDQVFLYPNPFGETITINIRNGKNYNLELRDISGNLILNKMNIRNNTTLDLGYLPSGFFLGTFTFEDGTKEVKKIIKR